MIPRPILALESWGPDVVIVQTCLEVMPLDGDFGQITYSAVVRFQKAQHIEADGIVGPATWDKLEKTYDIPPYPPLLLSPLSTSQEAQIFSIVDSSEAVGYSWHDRERSPIGYAHGMGMGFATVVRKYLEKHSAAHEMAKANTGNMADR